MFLVKITCFFLYSKISIKPDTKKRMDNERERERAHENEMTFNNIGLTKTVENLESP